MAVSLATLGAAERSRTAFDRLRDATHASDVALITSGGDPANTLRSARQIPGVIDARAMSELFVRPAGSDLVPTYTLEAIAPRREDGSTVDTPIVTEGRPPRPDRPHEVAVSANLADELDLGPGDELPLESVTEDWVEKAFAGADPGPPDGPAMTVTVTGIARSPADFGRYPSVIHLTPAFVQRYDGHLLRRDAVFVRVGPDDAEGLAVGDVVQPANSPVAVSPFRDEGQTEDGLQTIAAALRIVGLVAAAVGVLALALALARASRASKPGRETLVALGWTRADERRAIALTQLPSLVSGVAIGIVVGVLASPRAMVALARAIDPRPSSVLVSSRLVLAFGVGAVTASVALVGLGGLLGARGSSRSSSRVAGSSLGHPLAPRLGLRQALFAPTGRGGRAGRGAIASMLGATALALAALVIGSSIGALEADPALTGHWSDRLIDSGESTDVYDEVMPRLEADPRVDGLAGTHVAFGHLRGVGEVSMLLYDLRQGDLEESVTDGRMPSAPDEVALGPATAEEAGVRVGDEITLSGAAGAGRFRVVGEVLFPEGDFSHDQGAALTVDGGREVVGDPHDGADIHQVLFDWKEGVDATSAEAELAADGVSVQDSRDLRRPGTVNNLEHVVQLPRQLALLVALLGLLTLLHAAWAGVALGAAELGTLRALGLTRRSTAVMTWTRTVVTVVIGVVVGVPLGMAIGRVIWRPIAEGAHVVVRPVLGLMWLGVLLAVAFGAALGVAALAGRWANRLRPGIVLRAE